jgi:hypothetical protein
MSINLKTNRTETPFYVALKRFTVPVMRFDMRFWNWWGLLLRAIHVTVNFTICWFRRIVAAVQNGPIFKTHWVSCGRDVYPGLVPCTSRPVQVVVHSRISLSWAMAIGCGYVFDEPELPLREPSRLASYAR